MKQTRLDRYRPWYQTQQTTLSQWERWLRNIQELKSMDTDRMEFRQLD